VLTVVACACLSACQATVRVAVDARSNGAGTVVVTVTLDRDATQAVPDLAQELRTADLAQAGWHIDGPRPAPGGGSKVAASKPFVTIAQANQVLGELSGPGGPFQLRIGQRRSFWSTSTAFAGTVDLTCGLNCFGDAQLGQQLGSNLGLDPAKLQQAGIVPAQILGFQVGVQLPGRLRSSNAPDRVDGDPQWSLKLGQRALLLATSRAVEGSRIAVVAAVAAFGVAAAVVLLAVGWRRRRRRRSRRSRGSQGDGPTPEHARWRPRHRAARR
jgi:hypothetical protein